MGKSFNTGRLGNGLFTDANGNVGVNTTTLTSGIPFSINVATGNNCNIAFQENASDKWYLRNITSSNAFSFYSVASSTEVIRLTSDGKLGVGTSTPGRQVEIYNATDAYLKFNGQRVGNIAYTIGSDAAGFIIYDDTNGAYKFVIKQNGNVGISVTSPASKLEINGYGTANSIMTQPIIAAYASNGFNLGSDGTNALIGVSNSGTDMVFLKRVGGVYSEAVRIASSGNMGINVTSPTNGQLQIYNAAGNTLSLQKSTGSAAIAMGSSSLDFALLESINGGGLRIYTGNGTVTERFRITDSGVKFQNGSTYLNYYEEGTFNPASLDTNFGAVTPIFGRYVRIGNQITVNCRWNVTASTGKRYIVFNLPFAFYDNANINYTGAVSNYANGDSSYSSNVGTSVRNSSGSTTQQYVEAVYTSYGSGVTLLFSITYQTF